MRTFSVETWQMASETEAAQFEAALREVDDALQQLESSAAPSDIATTPESIWQADLHDLNQRLEELQQDPFE